MEGPVIQQQNPPPRHDVAAAYCVPPIHEGMMHLPFVTSLMNAVSHEASHTQRLYTVINVAHAYIPQGRTDAVRMFLDTGCDWLWFLDYDMVFEPDVLEKLMAVADPIDRPIVSALYFNIFADGQKYPVWLQEGETVEITNITRVRSGELRPVASVGMGCTVIHRSVFQKLAAKHADDPWPWYGHDIIGDQRAGEDVTFCLRARAAGFKVWGYAGVICEHIKSARVTWANSGELMQVNERTGEPV